MEVTKELLEQKLADYQKQLEQLTGQANLFSGAIQDAKHWLAVLEKEQTQDNPASEAVSTT